MMELVNSEEPVIKRLNTEPVHCEPERRMCANKHLVITREKRCD